MTGPSSISSFNRPNNITRRIYTTTALPAAFFKSCGKEEIEIDGRVSIPGKEKF
jgi:hypothetical protein